MCRRAIIIWNSSISLAGAGGADTARSTEDPGRERSGLGSIPINGGDRS